MEFTENTKIIIGLVTAIVTIAVTYLNVFGQTRKIKSELLEKFEIAVEKSQKHSVTELFRLIHGLRMSYSDILALIQHDECSKIIYALKKTPGVVSFENGEFKYSTIWKNRFWQSFDKGFLHFSIAIFGLLLVLSLIALVYSQGISSFVGFLFTLFCSVILAIQLRERRYNQMVAQLVQPQQISEIQPASSDLNGN